MRPCIGVVRIAASSVLAFSIAASIALAPPASAAKHKPKPKPKSFSSCSVVTQSEASSAIGAPVSKGVLAHATVEGGIACVFYGPSTPTPRTPNVAQPDTVRVVVVKGANATKWYADYKSRVVAQSIAGYGNQAYYDGYASLSILKGNFYVRIAVSPAGTSPSLSDEEHLAAAILPKL